MTISKTQHTLLLGAAALVLDRINAHGYCSRPAVTFPTGVDTTQYIATIESSASGLSGSFTGSPADNAAAFWTAFQSSKYSSIKDFATSLGQIVANGATIECGLTDPNETPQQLPDELEWSHSDTEGFTASHEGPCEAWCDNTQVFQDKNCAAHYTTAPAKMPYDKAKCSGASRFTFYWLALHSSTWQVYVNCAAIEGGSGLYSPSQTDMNTSESTEQSSPLPTSTNSVPATANKTNASSDQSYSFTGTTAAPSPSTSTTVPMNTSEATGQSVTTTPTTSTPTPSTPEPVPTNSAAPSDPSYTFLGTAAAPSATTAPMNTSEATGQSLATPTTPTATLSTNSLAPSAQSHTSSGTNATLSTEVTPTPAVNATPASSSGGGQNVEPVGGVGSDEDCGSLDIAGDGDNGVVANTAAVVDEDCGSLDLAGQDDMEDCGSLDLAGGSHDGVGSHANGNSMTPESVGSLASGASTAFSESSLNFDDVGRNYIGGKVQAPVQN